MGTIDVMRADVNDLKSDSYSAKKDVSDIREAISGLKHDMGNLNVLAEEAAAAKNLREGQAELYSQMMVFQKEVQAMRGRLDEQTHKASESLSKASKEGELLAARLDALELNLKELSAKLSAAEEYIQKVEASTKKDKGQAALKQPVVPDAEKAYEEAYAAFTDKRYGEAGEKFAAFIKTFSGHRLAGNAQFWIGETYYSQRDYESAILAYEEVFRKYKDSPKVSAAMLKQGRAFIEIGEKRAGGAILKELVAKYPESEQAVAARIKLRELEFPEPKAEKPAESLKK